MSSSLHLVSCYRVLLKLRPLIRKKQWRENLVTTYNKFKNYIWNYMRRFCYIYKKVQKDEIDIYPQTNSIYVTTFENYILKIDCDKPEEGLETNSCSQNTLNALAIDEPLEYARLALDGEMQTCVDAIDSLYVLGYK